MGLNGLDENFCGRTLRNRSIAQPEETPVSPPPRARSPKKRQDSKQEGKADAKQQEQEAKSDAKLQEDSKQETKPDSKADAESEREEKVADSNSSSSEGEQWSASRKRGASCLEKDSEKAENCDKAKGASRENSPQIKRAKRCSRSAETQGQDEEEAAVPNAKGNLAESGADSNGGDLSGSSNSKEQVIKEAAAEEEVERLDDDGQVECDGTNGKNSYKASNGLKNQDETSRESSTNSLLNGGQAGEAAAAASTAPSPEPSVPCPISNTESQNQIEHVPEEIFVAKEQEVVEHVEVADVAREEQVVESNGQPSTPPRHEPSPPPPPPDTNNSPINNNSNSGDATPTPSSPHPEPNECNATFSELYEHRYTLRTPPNARANGGKTSPSETCPSPPPVTDNGPTTIREEVVVEEEEKIVPAEDISEVGASEEVQDEEEEDVTSKQEEPALKTAEEEDDDEEEEPDVYYFESDHLALKHNKDYQRLLQTIGVLEAQRTQAVVDLETLSRHQRDALDDPISFVEQLQKQVTLGLPCPQRVVQLPDISWEQYTSGLGDFEREFCDKKRKTRRLKLIFDKGLPLRPKSPVEPKKEGESSSMYLPLPMSDAPENSRQTQMIRGRICHPNKPDTFNQLWTVEEQKKLEQLLIKFPPEEVESRRWQKIADELGNRTAKQVASRVQKYFIKLTKAGIPVPGRIPNLCMYTKKASTKRQHHLNKHLYRPSTFMTSYEPPVFMDEEDERSSYYSNSQDQAAEESDEEVPVELRTLPEYKELLELKRLKKQRLQEIQDDQTNVRHIGFKCDVCGTEPIQGVRWHCQDCPPDNSVDFCSNCSDCLLKTDTHRPSHHLEPVYRPETFLDRDYCLPRSTAGYNYLDPNYFPANR